ncbi:hypothetical protein Cgig2_009709 [Carnegiea gigantea]|uniref:Uncharacterized protein n=1 Tax=Carnegiea gigantea TaxID=171969 RepID=A0A9Q1K5D9_9CARY|nr:hypothetical protein Cgig2_009709 [Carnegiea gigantea]
MADSAVANFTEWQLSTQKDGSVVSWRGGFLICAFVHIKQLESAEIVFDDIVEIEGLESALSSRFNDFGTNGGSAAMALCSKFSSLLKHVLSYTRAKLPPVEMRHLIAAFIALKGLRSLFFIFGSSLGAYLLLLHQALDTPILYEFYNYDADHKEFTQHFVKFAQNLVLFGALLFYIGMKNSMLRRQLKKKAPQAKTT